MPSINFVNSTNERRPKGIGLGGTSFSDFCDEVRRREVAPVTVYDGRADEIRSESVLCFPIIYNARVLKRRNQRVRSSFIFVHFK